LDVDHDYETNENDTRRDWSCDFFACQCTWTFKREELNGKPLRRAKIKEEKIVSFRFRVSITTDNTVNTDGYRISNIDEIITML
jgi:hypothetical protein